MQITVPRTKFFLDVSEGPIWSNNDAGVTSSINILFKTGTPGQIRTDTFTASKADDSTNWPTGAYKNNLKSRI